MIKAINTARRRSLVERRQTDCCRTEAACLQGHLRLRRQSRHALRCQPCPDNWTPTSRPQCQAGWVRRRRFSAGISIRWWTIQMSTGRCELSSRTITLVHPRTNRLVSMPVCWLSRRVRRWTTRKMARSWAVRRISLRSFRRWSDQLESRILTKDRTTTTSVIVNSLWSFRICNSHMPGPQSLERILRRTQPSPDPKIGWIDPAYAINAPSGSPTQARPI